MAALKMYSIGHLQQVSSLIPCTFALPWGKISLHHSANERTSYVVLWRRWNFKSVGHLLHVNSLVIGNFALPQNKSPARNRSKSNWVDMNFCW